MPDPSPAPASTLLSPLARDGDTWVWRPRADFGPWLRDQRQAHGLTLQAAATRLGVTVTACTSWRPAAGCARPRWS